MMLAEEVQTTFEIDKSSWTKVKLGDVVREVRETVKDPAAEGIERIVGLEHLEPESLHIKTWGALTDGTTFTKVFRKGQVLFGRRRAYLKKAALATFDGICSGDITVLEAKKGLLPELLPFLIQNDKFFELAVKNSAGSLSPRAKFADFADYKFLLPPVDKQEQIAELLWAGDKAIEICYNVREKLNAFKAASEKEKLSGNSKVKTKGIETTKYKITTEWPEVKLEEITTKITDGEHSTPRRSNEGIYLLSARNIHNDRLDLSNVDYIPEEEYVRISNRCNPEPGDILISCSGTVGRVCMVPPNLKFGLVRSVALIKPNKELVHPEFLMYTLQSVLIQSTIDRVINKTAQPNLFLGQIKALKIYLPNLDEQKAVSNYLRSIDDMIGLCNTQIIDSQTLQKAIINQVI